MKNGKYLYSAICKTTVELLRISCENMKEIFGNQIISSIKCVIDTLMNIKIFKKMNPFCLLVFAAFSEFRRFKFGEVIQKQGSLNR